VVVVYASEVAAGVIVEVEVAVSVGVGFFLFALSAEMESTTTGGSDIQGAAGAAEESLLCWSEMETVSFIAPGRSTSTSYERAVSTTSAGGSAHADGDDDGAEGFTREDRRGAAFAESGTGPRF